MAHLFNPIRTYLLNGPEGNRSVIIEPELRQDDLRLHYEGTGVYKIYQDSFGDATELITLPHPHQVNQPANNAHPDYLGSLIFEGENWRYEGALLLWVEQAELAEIITSYTESDPDIDL